jgi:DNA polymerase-3 subunit delta'
VLGADPDAHPDLYVIEPESKSRRIIIEQVRELEHGLRLRASLAGGRKVGIIREADRLQPQAANAFLKTLEEPPAESLLLLVTAHPESLLDTIRSRCIRVTLLPGAGQEAALRTPEETALLALLDRTAASNSKSGVGVAYGLLREVNQLLASIRARVQSEQEAALDREEAHYAQTTDGSWLSEREAYYKGLTEARYVAERARLIQTLARWWGDVLRQQSGAAPEVVAAILSKLAAIADLAENLDRNVQEALALEAAMLRIYAA